MALVEMDFANGSGGLNYSDYNMSGNAGSSVATHTITIDLTHTYFIRGFCIYGSSESYTEAHIIDGQLVEDERHDAQYPVTISLNGTTLTISAGWYCGYYMIDFIP